MSRSANTDKLTPLVYQFVSQIMASDKTAAVVQLESGGVIVTASNGDHVRVLVQEIHFETGPELPF